MALSLNLLLGTNIPLRRLSGFQDNWKNHVMRAAGCCATIVPSPKVFPMSMVSEVNDLTTATITEAAEVAHDQYDRLIAVIRRNPLQSASIAAGIGFVGALVARGFFK